MVETFVETETDRTKSKWVASVLKEFAKPRTTVRSLFYYALQREQSDYPICGGFVGEIRITRNYHFSDGTRLSKWVDKARLLGFIPAGSIIEETKGERLFLPESFLQSCKKGKDDLHEPGSRIEVWISRSSLNPLLLPVCSRHCAALVSVDGMPTGRDIDDLIRRSDNSRTTVLCLSDLSPSGLAFFRDLKSRTGKENIELEQVGLTPDQVIEFRIPMVPLKSGVEDRSTKEMQKVFKSYLKPYGLDAKLAAELDALEVYYPGGIAGFLEKAINPFLPAL